MAIDNVAAERAPGFEARFARSSIDSEHLGVSYFAYPPGTQWDVVRVAPQVVRGFESGPDGIMYIAVGNDRPEGGDGQRVDDFWPAD